MQSGTFTNVPFVVIENYNNDRDAKIDSIGFNTKYQFNDNWSVEADLSWSKVEREDLRLESTAGNGTNNDPTFLPQRTRCRSPPARWHHGLHADAELQHYGTVFLTDPGAWGGGLRRSGFVGNPDITDEIKAIRLSATRKFEGFLSDVTFGVNYADRTKGKEQFQSNLWLPGNISHVGGAGGVSHRYRGHARSSAARTA